VTPAQAPGIPDSLCSVVWFTGGSVAVPSGMRRSEIDITAVGVGMAAVCEVVTGASCTIFGP
jgi:hypothetical protein